MDINESEKSGQPAGAEAFERLAERAEVLAREGRHVKACLLYERLIERLIAAQSDDPAYHFRLAESLAARGRHAPAIQRYRKALLLGYTPRGPARVSLARAQSGMQNDDEALATLEEACREEPGLAEGHLALGDIQFRQARLAEAADSYRRASEADARNPAAWIRWAETLERLGDPAQACDRALRALACSPADRDAYDLLGRLLPRLPDPGRVLEQVWALILDARDLDALFSCSNMVLDLGQAAWLARQWELVLLALEQGWAEADDEGYPRILDSLFRALAERTEALRNLRRLARKAGRAWLWLLLADWHEPAEAAAYTRNILSALRADCADKATHLRLKARLSDEALPAAERERLITSIGEILEQARDPDRQARGRLRWALTLRYLGRADAAAALLDAALAGAIQDATRAWIHGKWGRWVYDGQQSVAHLLQAFLLGGEPDLLIEAARQQGLSDDLFGQIDEAMQERADPALYLRWAAALLERQEREGVRPVTAEQHRGLLDRVGALVAGSVSAGDHLAWAGILVKAGVTDEAIQAYGKAAELDPDLGRPWLERASLQRSRGRLDDALRDCAAAIEAEPDHAKAYERWLEILEQAENGALLDPLRQALGGPDIGAARPTDLGALDAIRREHDEKLAGLVAQIEHNCDAPRVDVYVNCGVILDRMKRSRLALRLFQRATELRADHFWANYDAGAMLRLLGRYEEAATYHRRCQELEPDSFNAHSGLAMVYLGSHQYPQAIDAFKQAFERGLSFNDAFGTDARQRIDAYNDWAMALGEIKRYPEALEQNRLALCIDPTDFWAHFRRAYTLADMGLFDEARLEYEATIRYDQDRNNPNPYPHHNIADLLNLQGRYREARRHWREVIDCYQKGLPARIAGRDSDYCLYYATTLASVREDWAGAERLLLAARSLNPEDLQIHIALAKHYLNRRKALDSKRSMRLRDLLADCLPAPESSAGDAAKRDGARVLAGVCLGLRNTPYRRQEQLLQEQSRLYALAQASYRQVLDSVERGLGPDRARGASLLKDLGELHLAFDDPRAARAAFSQALATDASSARALRGLGEADLRLQDSTAAQANLAAAHRLAPHDLAIRLSLAQALASGRPEAAEAEYSRILSEVPNHVDALVGLADVHVDMADKRSAERDDLIKEDYYQRAIDGYGKALDLMDGGSEDRPILIQASPASVLYQRGYARWQLYRMRRWYFVDRKLRQDALKDFRACTQRDPSHLKAQRAVELLHDARRQSKSFVERWVPLLIFIFSVAVFAVAQWIALAGMDQTPPSASAALRPLGLDSIGGIMGLYAVLSFGSLLFMIAGAFLPQLTSLKLGSLQMEKSAGEALESVRGLGITGQAASGLGGQRK